MPSTGQLAYNSVQEETKAELLANETPTPGVNPGSFKLAPDGTGSHSSARNSARSIQEDIKTNERVAVVDEEQSLPD